MSYAEGKPSADDVLIWCQEIWPGRSNYPSRSCRLMFAQAVCVLRDHKYREREKPDELLEQTRKAQAAAAAFCKHAKRLRVFLQTEIDDWEACLSSIDITDDKRGTFVEFKPLRELISKRNALGLAIDNVNSCRATALHVRQPRLYPRNDLRYRYIELQIREMWNRTLEAELLQVSLQHKHSTKNLLLDEMRKSKSRKLKLSYSEDSLLILFINLVLTKGLGEKKRPEESIRTALRRLQKGDKKT